MKLEEDEFVPKAESVVLDEARDGKWTMAIAMGFVANVVVTIVAMGQVMQLNITFVKPFFTVYLNYMFCIITFPVYFALLGLYRRPASVMDIYEEICNDFRLNHTLTFRRFLVCCVPMAVSSVFAFGLYWFALTKTSLGSVMTLINLIPVFCYVISAVFIGHARDYVSFLRVGAVLLTIGGAVGITYADMLGSESHWIGDVAMVFSAFLWSIIDVITKTIVSEKCICAPYLMLSVYGLASTLLLWPFFFVFDTTGYESFEMPNGTAAGLASISWVEASSAYTVIRLVSPVFFTVSLTLCTPLSYILDALVNHIVPSAGKIVAICVIVVGYLILAGTYAGYDIGTQWIPVPGGLCKMAIDQESGKIEEVPLEETSELIRKNDILDKNYGAFEKKTI